MKFWLYQLRLPLLLLLAILVVGTVGYIIIEQYSFIEALYMTTLAITTVGFGEVRPLTTTGQIFTIILLISSWSTLAFVLARITQFIISGEINKYFKTKRIMDKVSNLSNHTIICGFGRNGQQAANTLKAHNVPFLVIEKSEELVSKFIAEHFEVLYLTGDATEDETLQKAMIKNAKALITALPDDADNVFIVLSARSLNNTIQIISRASNSNSIPKLKKAGADSVILPDKIGGTHMATLVSKPDVIEFIDYLSGEEGEGINIESVNFNELPNAIQNKTLEEVMNWQKTGVTCIGIKNSDGKFIINPPGITVINNGMKVIVLGTRRQIDSMKGNLDG